MHRWKGLIFGAMLFILAFGIGTSIQTHKKDQFVIEEEIAAEEYIPSPSPADATPVTTETAEKININTATAAELETLYGIGPVIAGRIIEYRARNGGFHTAEELMNVSGIGNKKFAALKESICVE